jgi:ComF family protein
MKLVDAALNWIFAPCCAACDAAVTAGAGFCPGCASSLVELGPACPRCAEPQLEPPARLCRRCVAAPAEPSVITAPWRYGGAIADAITRVKFGGSVETARTLGVAIAPFVAAVTAAAEVQRIVPVPLHWRRRLRRGFDQTQLILGFAAAGNVPVVRALRRQRATRPQVGQRAKEREDNLRRAFAATRAARQVAGRRVLLVDDVVTTGATMRAAAAVLMAAGARDVIGLCLARAEAP